jgi:hypothetical protein
MNRVGVVEEVVNQVSTNTTTMNLKILCRHARVRFIDSRM